MAGFDNQFVSIDEAGFDEFFADTAVISGSRREQSASRTLSLSVPCCLLGGEDPAELPSGALAPTYERMWRVVIRRADWPEHVPPQSGDSVTISGQPLLRVSSVLPYGSGWLLNCRSKEAGK